MNKELETQFATTDLNLNIRIFAQKRSFLCWISRLLKKERVFYMKDFSALSTERIEHLHLIVAPVEKSQGITGAAYISKQLCFDFELNEHRSMQDYKMSARQVEVTNDTKFVIAAPIFKSERKDKIVSIVTFDSKKVVTLPADDIWKRTIRDACKVIHKCSPYLN